jgi:hypothetical protein
VCPDNSCSVLCTSVNVDGFPSTSPSNVINWSHNLEGFATVSVFQKRLAKEHNDNKELKPLNELLGHNRQKSPRVSAARARPRAQHCVAYRICQNTYQIILLSGGEKAACDVSGEETRALPWLSSGSLGRTALLPAAGSCGGTLGHETSSVGGVTHRAAAIVQDPAPSQSHVSGPTVAGVGCRRPALCQDPKIFIHVNYHRYIRTYY